MMKFSIPRTFSVALALSFVTVAARADEGMWLLTQVAKLALKEKGLQIDPARIYSADGPCLAHAIVQVDGGTGEFVSPDGLILTNHHVVFDGVQQVSSEGKNYVDNGFLARAREDEPFVTGYDAIITLRVAEVTEEMLEGLAADASEEERQRHVRVRGNEITSAAQDKGEAHYTYLIVEHFNGARFFLYTKLILPDVRLVYAPPKSIGEFGGDIDNFMWPRHCADFGMFRAYVGRDGKPAKHSKDNVPYRPQSWLPISTAGVAPGDFTFVLGHPGATMRERSAYSMRFHRDTQLPQQIQQIEGIIAQLEQASKESETAYLENISNIKSLNNALKNFVGKVDGMQRRGLVEKKSAEDDKLRAFVAGDSAAEARWGTVFQELEAVYSRLPHLAAIGQAVQQLERTEVMKLASRIPKLAAQLGMSDAQRERAYRDDRREKLITDAQASLAKVQSDDGVQAFADAVANFAEVPDEALPPKLSQVVAGKSGEERAESLTAFAKELVAQSAIAKEGQLKAWLGATDASEIDLKDPLVGFASDIAELKDLTSQQGLNRSLAALRRHLYEMRSAMGGKELYPDANSTLRFTYGYVKGYSPRDAVMYTPITTVQGVLEKESGEAPFASPPKLLDLLRAGSFGRWADPRHNNSVPVAFTHTVDITGGNSGSPALNAKGELVGIVFDGNFESLTADYIYDDSITRCISVDIRYCLFLLERYEEATELLNELGFRS